MSIALRYHPLIPNRTCHVNLETLEGDCPIFKDIRFEDITVASATTAGDISGFVGDPLHGLAFKNVTLSKAMSAGLTLKVMDKDGLLDSDDAMETLQNYYIKIRQGLVEEDAELERRGKAPRAVPITVRQLEAIVRINQRREQDLAAQCSRYQIEHKERIDETTGATKVQEIEAQSRMDVLIAQAKGDFEVAQDGLVALLRAGVAAAGPLVGAPAGAADAAAGASLPSYE